MKIIIVKLEGSDRGIEIHAYLPYPPFEDYGRKQISDDASREEEKEYLNDYKAFLKKANADRDKALIEYVLLHLGDAILTQPKKRR